MRKATVLGLATLITASAACVGEAREESSDAATDPRAATRARQAEASQPTSSASFRVHALETAAWKTVTHLEAPRGQGFAVLQPGMRADEIASRTLGLVDRHRGSFKIGNAAAELRLERAHVDARAMTHVRFQQVHRGVPVTGAELAAHYDAAGRLTSIDANYVPNLERLDVQPRLDERAGAELAKADVLARLQLAADADRVSCSEGRLVVSASSNAVPALAYEYSVRAVFGPAPAIWVTTVDAKTGAILDRYNNLQTVQATAPGVDGTAKKFEVSASGGGYTMIDASRGAQIRTYTAENAEVQPGAAIGSSSLTTWDRTAIGAGAAVDAHVNAVAVYDYYKSEHARNGIDGAGGAMISTAHFGDAFDNAFWDPNRGQMAYGDGATIFRPLSAGIDVVAHEFTHGVTAATSNLRYQGQSGALNEAVSDIFAAFIEHVVRPSATDNWTIGEQVLLQAGLLRDFRNPAAGSQPAHMTRYVNTQQDSGGVHINSGIINNAAFLMTASGTNPVSKVAVPFGIGFEKASKLWYRANSEYFLSATNFAQATAALQQAAKDLAFTDNELNIVECAWKATGLAAGACAEITDPTAAPTAIDPLPSASAAEGEEEEAAAPVGEPAPGLPEISGKRAAQATSGGCSAAPHGARSALPLTMMAVAAGVLASRRRRRR